MGSPMLRMEPGLPFGKPVIRAVHGILACPTFLGVTVFVAHLIQKWNGLSSMRWQFLFADGY